MCCGKFIAFPWPKTVSASPDLIQLSNLMIRRTRSDNLTCRSVSWRSRKPILWNAMAAAFHHLSGQICPRLPKFYAHGCLSNCPWFIIRGLQWSAWDTYMNKRRLAQEWIQGLRFIRCAAAKKNVANSIKRKKGGPIAKGNVKKAGMRVRHYFSSKSTGLGGGFAVYHLGQNTFWWSVLMHILIHSRQSEICISRSVTYITPHSCNLIRWQ